MSAGRQGPDVPSTLVHLAIACLIAAALLGRAYGVRSLAVVLGVVAFVDLDVFVGMVVLGAHRAAFHTLLWPGIAAAALAYDVRIRERSWLRERAGEHAPRVAAVAVVAVAFAGVAPDLVTNGANVLYPLHDQFYALDGRIRLSTERGLVQTFVEEETARGSSGETQYYTGADPDPESGGAEPDAERTFMVVDSGMEALLVVLGSVTAVAKLAVARPADGDD